MMVVLSHAALLAGTAVESALAPWGLGNIAVMSFFVLSGYIIAEAIQLFYSRRIDAFLLNRALRIIPPYFVALAISIAIHAWLASHGTMQFFDYSSPPEGMLSARNIVSNALSIGVLYGLGHINLQPDYLFVRYVWAVRVELHFYVVYALLVWLSNTDRFRLGSNGRKPLWQRFLPYAAFVIVGCAAVVAIMSGWSALNYFYFAPHFMLGVSLYWYVERNGDWAAKLALGTSFALALFQFFTYVGKREEIYALASTVVFATIALAVLLLASTQASAMARRVDRWFGDLSYPIYLNHYAVAILVVTVATVHRPWLIVVCTMLTIGVAWLAALVTEPITARVRNTIRGAELR